MGYGARALQALEAFYRGDYFNLDESEAAPAEYSRDDRIDQVGNALYHHLIRRSSLTH